MRLDDLTLDQWLSVIQQFCLAAGLISAQALAIRKAWQGVQAIRSQKAGAAIVPDASQGPDAATTA